MFTLGFSPCPNDTFIFDAMLHGRIDTEGLSFKVYMEDVEALNRRALAGELQITKLSYHALGWLTDKYKLLRSGSALGNNCGPLLIAKKTYSAEEINSLRIAIPGRYTTANFLLGLAFPDAKNKVEMLFSDIENAVLNGQVDAGLIIHENRFTYQDKGLIKLIDLGQYWEDTTHYPIPLGGIVVHRDVPTETQQKINRVLRRSVEYAFAHPSDSLPFTCAHAQEMDEKVMQQHINLYVNQYSIDLGDKGIAAVKHLYRTAVEKGILPGIADDLMVE